MGKTPGRTRIVGIVRMAVMSVVFTAVVVVLIMWLAGAFTAKAGPETAVARTERRLAPGARTADVEMRAMPRMETAVGTIRPVHESSVASKLLAKVVEVNATAGQSVERGAVIARLDDEELRSRVEQADAEIRSAQAEETHAQEVVDRLEAAYEAGAATLLELNRARTTLNTASAELARLKQARQEAATVLGYATIAAPISGVVVEKYVEPGDTVSPGQIVAKIMDPTRMQLVASVRESLAQRLVVGDGIGVTVDAIGRQCTGSISEIVPEAESASRAFTVKVTGPCPPGVYAGMFGRLMIPLDEERVLLVPSAAVQRIGQLQIVDVVDDGLLRRRAVETGRRFDDAVEILSGLHPGERVALAGSPDAPGS